MRMPCNASCGNTHMLYNTDTGCPCVCTPYRANIARAHGAAVQRQLTCLFVRGQFGKLLICHVECVFSTLFQLARELTIHAASTTDLTKGALV